VEEKFGVNSIWAGGLTLVEAPQGRVELAKGDRRDRSGERERERGWGGCTKGATGDPSEVRDEGLSAGAIGGKGLA